MNRPVHFEIHAPDAASVADFFGNVFGWSFQSWGDSKDYLLANTGEQGTGINGAVMTSRDGQARVVNTIEVDSVNATARLVTENGGTVVVQKFAVPGVGWVIYFTDPGGALSGAMESDADAA